VAHPSAQGGGDHQHRNGVISAVTRRLPPAATRQVGGGHAMMTGTNIRRDPVV